MGALLCGNLVPLNVKLVQAASAKKTVIVKLDKKNPRKCVSVKTTIKNPKYPDNDKKLKAYYRKVGVSIKIQIISMKGKPKEKSFDLFNSISEDGKGCLIFGFPRKKFTRGVIYNDKSKMFHHVGDTKVNMDLDEIKGVSKITYKITFTNPSGKKIFKNVKVKKGLGNF